MKVVRIAAPLTLEATCLSDRVGCYLHRHLLSDVVRSGRISMVGILTDTVTGNVNGTLIVTSRLIEEASQPPVPQQYSFHLNGMSRRSDFHDVPGEFALDNVEKRKLSEPPPRR